MRARHVLFVAAVLAAVFAMWAIGTTPAPTQAETQAHFIRPFGA
jgi:hypothetical protein